MRRVGLLELLESAGLPRVGCPRALGCGSSAAWEGDSCTAAVLGLVVRDVPPSRVVVKHCWRLGHSLTWFG